VSAARGRGPLSRLDSCLDTGTHETLLSVSSFIQAIEERHGLRVLCPEEIAQRMGYITAEQLEALAASLNKNGDGQYLLRLLQDRVL